MMGRATSLIADAVFPVASEPVLALSGDPVRVLIEGDRVSSIGHASEIDPPPAAETIDLTGCLVVPGLVNAHTHLQYSCFGEAIRTREFFEWVRAVTTLIPSMDAEAWLASSRAGALENLQAGVAHMADVFSRKESLAAAAEAGIGGVAFFEVIGPGPDEAALAASALERRLDALADAASAAGLTLGLSPHAPYTCHPVLYAAARRLADRERLPLATHVSETRDESTVFRDGSGPFSLYMAARRPDFRPPRASPIRYLDTLGFWSGGRALAVHAVHATRADLEILAAREVAVVTCPSSNIALGAGRADVPAMNRVGLRVAVGSDSLASVAHIDLLAELGMLAGRHRSLTPSRLLAMATRDGAEILGLEPGTGTLAPGAPADLTAFPLPSETRGGPGVADRMLGALFAEAPRARAVLRRGRPLLLDGEPVGLDAREVLAEAAAVTARLARLAEGGSGVV